MINFDMPEEIENYVHRIGRTGRRGRSGLATTFVSHKEDSDTILLDLKHLLMEAKQPIPPVLQVCVACRRPASNDLARTYAHACMRASILERVTWGEALPTSVAC